MTVVFALCAAFCNAFNVVAQHRASTADPSRHGFAALARALASSPLWWTGSLALVGAFVFQAVALYHGTLSIVQPLLVTELVFALVLRRFWIGQAISAAAWGSAALVCLGLAVFVDVAEPRGGHAAPTSAAWLSALLAFGLLVGLLALLGLRGSPVRRAALYAAAAAVTWALEATFIKAATDTFSSDGVWASLGRWPVYAVIAGGVVGTLLAQVALHVGPLSVSQPVMVTLDPLVSIVLGIWIFGEHFTDDPATIALAAASFAVMAVGIVLLTRYAPATLEATGDRSPAPS
jgi:drug/metabolite transporter (DMT)-like permease